MADENQGSPVAAEETYFNTGGEQGTLTPEAEKPNGEEKAGLPTEEVNSDGSALVRDDKGRFVKTIPFDVFHAEREEHKQTKAKLGELSDFKARMEERWRLLENAATQAAPAKEEDPEPDASVDIFAHNAWLKRQLSKVTDGIAQRDRQTQEQAAAAEGEKKVWNYWNQDAAAYKAKPENADFDESVKWMSAERTKQLKALSGLHPKFKTENGIVEQINSELRDIVIAAANNRISPAEYIHNMAKEWGWKATPPAGNGSLTLPEQLARVAAAQDASRTVGGAGGSPAGQELTLEQIMAMAPAEFRTWHSDPKNSRRYDKLMGA
jgi:hypothetical protein